MLIAQAAVYIPAVATVAVAIVTGFFGLMAARYHVGGDEVLRLLEECANERRELRKQLIAALSDPGLGAGGNSGGNARVDT